MPSAASVSFNRTSRTLADLARFAEQSTDEARNYLRTVQTSLSALGSVEAARGIEQLLSQPDLVAGIRNANGLEQLFAPPPERTETIGWIATEVASKPAYVRGTLERREGDFLWLKTAGGREFPLASGSNGAERYTPLRIEFMSFVGEGEVVVKGTLGNDGETFKMEAAAPYRPGYETFEAGRVAVNGDEVRINTSRASVVVTDEELKRQLRRLPNLGVIVPGEARQDGTRWVYDQNPREFFVLTGFAEQNVYPPNDDFAWKSWVPANMAYSNSEFKSKALLIPEEQRDRVNHSARLWALGRFHFNTDGTLRVFDASYITRQSDWGNLRPWLPDGTVRQSAIRLAEALGPKEPPVVWSTSFS